MDRAILDQIVAKSRDAAKGGFGALSTGEKLAAAIALNRPDWLQEMGYTITEAMKRIGADWMAEVLAASEILDREGLVRRQ